MKVAWQFYDPIGDESYSFPVNPNADTSNIGVNKNITYSVASAAYSGDNGATPADIPYTNVSVILDSVDEVKSFNFSGILYSAEEYFWLMYWSTRNNYVELTDDIGRTFEVYVTSFKTERVRSRKFPWKHSYSMETVVRNGS